jgi:hypothetical protein
LPVGEAIATSARTRPSIRGGVALQVFIEVGRDAGAGSADRRGDVVGREKCQLAVDENRCLPCRLAALFGTVDTNQDATEHGAALGVRRFGDGVHGVISIPFEIPLGSPFQVPAPIGAPPHPSKVSAPLLTLRADTNSE